MRSRSTRARSRASPPAGVERRLLHHGDAVEDEADAGGRLVDAGLQRRQALVERHPARRARPGVGVAAQVVDVAPQGGGVGGQRVEEDPRLADVLTEVGEGALVRGHGGLRAAQAPVLLRLDGPQLGVERLDGGEHGTVVRRLLHRRHAQHPQQRLAHHAARPGSHGRIRHVGVLGDLVDVAEEGVAIGVRHRGGFVEDPGGQLLDEGDVGVGSCGHGLTCAAASGCAGA